MIVLVAVEYPDGPPVVWVLERDGRPVHSALDPRGLSRKVEGGVYVEQTAAYVPLAEVQRISRLANVDAPRALEDLRDLIDAVEAL